MSYSLARMRIYEIQCIRFSVLDMLKTSRSPRFVQAYFGAYLISYVRPQRNWSTELVPLEIPPAVRSSYSEAQRT